MSTNDMVVQGVGKNIPKKGAPQKQEQQQLEFDKVLESVKQNALSKVRYTTIDIKSLNSVLLKDNEIFNGLKMALETFNQEILHALVQKKDLDNYPFKKNLFAGLRNLLMEVVETENKELRNKLLEKASNWFSDKLAKKEPPDSQRPTTAMTATGRGSARPWTSQTQGSLITPFNMSNIHGGESYRDSPTKSFLETDRKLLPSEMRAEILRDYEVGARSKHDYTNPPYERIVEYERKVPNGILKPPTSHLGQRPPTEGKTTSFVEPPIKSVIMKKEEPKPEEEKKEGQPGEGQPVEGQPQGDGTGQPGEGAPAEGEGEGGDEGEGDGEGEGEGDGGEAAPQGEGAPGDAPQVKLSIMMPRRKLYTDDKFTAKESLLKDRNIPMELRSTYASHAPKGDTYELALEHKYRHILNKKIQEKREKEEFTAVMHQWSYAKGRLDEEINRKNEALTFGSRFEVRAFNPRAQSATVHSAKRSKRVSSQDPKSTSQAEIEEIEENEDALPPDVDNMTAYMENGKKVLLSSKNYDMTMVRPIDVNTHDFLVQKKVEEHEAEIIKKKIENIKKMHSDLVFKPRDVPVEGYEGYSAEDRPSSLSVYDVKQPRLSQTYRPFSNIYTKINDQIARKAQLEEIEDVKKKLAKFKIKVPMKTLESSLLLPQIKPEEKTANFLQPGNRLMTNPFFKEKKGKKKKGKK